MALKTCYALLCAYDGSAFAGFQRQPPLPTVQQTLEQALRELGLPARIEGAGRTDRGVHACRQVVAFRTAAPVDPATLPERLGAHLPPELVVLAAREMPYAFHPRFSSRDKHYRYLLTVAPEPDDWARRYAWALPDPRGFPGIDEVRLDRAAVERALGHFVGTHDFSLLSHPNARGKTVRPLTSASLRVHEADGREVYAFDFSSPGFLRHQIRNMVGVAVSAGLSVVDEEEVRRLVTGKGDRWRGARAPGRGLSLVGVGYAPGEAPFGADPQCT